MATHNTLLQWQVYSERQCRTLDQIVELANRPLQTVESVHQIRETVEDELNQFPEAHEAIVVDYAEDCRRWLDASTNEIIRNLQQEDGFDGDVPALAWLASGGFSRTLANASAGQARSATRILARLANRNSIP